MRASVLNEIGDLIRASKFFDVADFEITSLEQRDANKLQIVYKYDDKYYFVAVIPRAKPSSNDYKIRITEAPGEINEKETNVVDSKYSLTSSIQQWLRRVKEELHAVPIVREVNEQKQKLEEIFDRLKDVEDVAFTREEAATLKAELDSLREQLIAQIQNSSSNKSELEGKIESINNDINSLKTNVEILNKPNWLRVAIARLNKWGQSPENRAMIKDGVAIAQKLISGGSDNP